MVQESRISDPQLIGLSYNRERDTAHAEIMPTKLNRKVTLMLPSKIRLSWIHCSRLYSSAIHRVLYRRRGRSDLYTKPPCTAFLDDCMDNETRATFGFLDNHMSRYQQIN